jgi:hypothetical protein
VSEKIELADRERILEILVSIDQHANRSIAHAENVNIPAFRAIGKLIDEAKAILAVSNPPAVRG